MDTYIHIYIHTYIHTYAHVLCFHLIQTYNSDAVLLRTDAGNIVIGDHGKDMHIYIHTYIYTHIYHAMIVTMGVRRLSLSNGS